MMQAPTRSATATDLRSCVETTLTRVVSALLSLLIVGCSGAPAEPSSPPSSSTTTILTASTGESSTTALSAVTSIPPIRGYGDFSGLEYFEVDSYVVTRLVVECMHDHGFPVTLIPPGDGYGFGSIPPEQNQLAQVYDEACWAGLNIPPYEDPDPAHREEIYEYYLALRDCLIAKGYDVSEPPSKEYFVENYNTDPWSPYESVGYVGPSWESIQIACPQQPVGGYAAWQPGDPVSPITPPNE